MKHSLPTPWLVVLLVVGLLTGTAGEVATAQDDQPFALAWNRGGGLPRAGTGTLDVPVADLLEFCPEGGNGRVRLPVADLLQAPPGTLTQAQLLWVATLFVAVCAELAGDTHRGTQGAPGALRAL